MISAGATFGEHRAARGMAMSDFSAGEFGGVFAGIVAFAAAAGKGLAWLLNWQGERSENRQKRLDAWELSLANREREYREGIETKIEGLEADQQRLRSQQSALGFSLLEVTLELRSVRPTSPALVRAATALRAAFPPEFGIPPEMTELVRALDNEEQVDGASRR